MPVGTFISLRRRGSSPRRDLLPAPSATATRSSSVLRARYLRGLHGAGGRAAHRLPHHASRRSGAHSQATRARILGDLRGSGSQAGWGSPGMPSRERATRQQVPRTSRILSCRRPLKAEAERVSRVHYPQRYEGVPEPPSVACAADTHVDAEAVAQSVFDLVLGHVVASRCG